MWKKGISRKHNKLSLLFILCLIVIVLWGLNLYFLYCLSPSERGTYGDMFGAVNSLFTGLAFAGLVTSIALQQGQMNHIEEDAEIRNKNERSNETLRLCQYYFTEMQTDFKEVSTKNMSIPQGFLPRFTKDMELTDITYDGLKDYGFYDLVNTGLNSPAEILLVLRKLEALAAILLHGNTEKKLAQKIIGDDYCAWVNKLLGYIAYYRKGEDINFCENIISLWYQWKKPID